MPETSLDTEVFDFALRLMETVAQILPAGDLGFQPTVHVRPDGSAMVTIGQADPLGLLVSVEGVELMRLIVSYRCIWSSSGTHLAIDSSSFLVNVKNSTTPLFHFDYVRNPSSSSVPVSHINVHAHRDEAIFALMASGVKERGKARAKKLIDGRMPRLADVHLPLGGHRFRPCLEDVLELLIHEFGIDRLPTADSAIAKGRRLYRRAQLMAAVSDEPEAAAEALRSLGYSVDGDNSVEPRVDRLSAY